MRKVIASVRLSGGKFQGMQQEGRNGISDKRRHPGSRFDDTNDAAWSKRDGEEENVRCEVFAYEDNRLPEELHEDWSEEVVEDGLRSRDSAGR